MLLTITVARDARYAGVGSKQHVIAGTGTIMKITQIFTDTQTPPLPQFSRTAIIENLIIDGQNQGGTTGILLQDVSNSFIRNITIKNCETGIHLYNTGGMWTESNNLQHIRMENVKTGILFSTDGWYSDNPHLPGDSFGHSHISDVSIALRDASDAVGIQIGNNKFVPGHEKKPLATDVVAAKPYFSFINANVWLGLLGGCGVRLVNGELKHCLINIGVHGRGTGIGLDISTATATNTLIKRQTPIEKNQTANPASNINGFLLYADGLTQNIKNKTAPNLAYDTSDVTVVTP